MHRLQRQSNSVSLSTRRLSSGFSLALMLAYSLYFWDCPHWGQRISFSISVDIPYCSSKV